MAKAVDWAAAKLAYVNSSKSLGAIAKQFNTTPSAVEKRASREKWSEARQDSSEKVRTAAQAAMTDVRTDELSRFNADDLKMARAIRAKAAGMMASVSTPNDLRALAGAVDTAQRVGRLALGASTENNAITGHGGGPVQTVNMSAKEFRQIAKDIAGEV